MTILEYYKIQQENPLWVQKFQSTGNDQSGKIFYFINTNYRKITSFVEQFKIFESKEGVDRSKWNNNQKTGQEKDKHRIMNLIRADLIEQRDTIYYPTAKGYVLKDLIHSKIEYSEQEIWFIVYLLILEFRTEERDLDIIKTVKSVFNNIKISGANIDLEKSIGHVISLSNKVQLFHTDIFWILSFIKDVNFLRMYSTSTVTEKNELYNYVEICSKDKKTKDCIAHKYAAGGAYSLGMFKEELKVLYYTDLLLKNQSSPIEQVVDELLSNYCKLQHGCNYKKIYQFLINHKSIYNNTLIKVCGGK